MGRRCWRPRFRPLGPLPRTTPIAQSPAHRIPSTVEISADNRWRRWAISGLATIAVGVSVYLAWMSHGGDVLPGCGGAEIVDCEHVLSTGWSRWMGLPVSYPAILVYVVILVASVTRYGASTTVRDTSETVLVLASLTAAGASLWFVFLQLFVVGKLCLYCFAAHLCGISIALLVLWPWVARRRPLPMASHVPVASPPMPVSAGDKLDCPRTARRLRYLVPLAGLVVAILIVGQVIVRPKTFAIGDAAELESPELELPDSHSTRSQDATETSGDQTAATRRTEPSADDVGPGTGTGGPSVDDLELAPESSTAPHDEQERRAPSASSSGTPSNAATSGADRRIVLAGGRVTLKVREHPRLGPLEAAHVAVKLFDYTCPQCRRMYEQFEQVRARYGSQLAILVLPVPLNAQCNFYLPYTYRTHTDDCRYARLALAVWRLGPSQFPAYHRWLMTGRHPPPISAAAERATRLFGRDALKAAIHDPRVTELIGQYVELFGISGKRLPFIVIENKTIRGVPGRVTELFDFFEQRLHFQPKADAVPAPN